MSVTIITNSHIYTVFRLVPTSVALNGVIALILLYFTEFDSFAGLLRHSGRKYCLQNIVSSSTLGQNWPTLQRAERGLSAIADTCYLK